ncbi:MAG: hypothetical protein AAF556_01645 [Pseudomonadota bacterium]
MKDKYLRYTLEAGSARIFNCLAITREILGDAAFVGETLVGTTNGVANGAAQLGDGSNPGANGQANDHGQRLFFENLGLNYTIFIKDMNPNYRRGEEETEERPIGTKIYVPFDLNNIYGGGKSIFASDRGFRNAITELIGEGDHLCPQAIARDLELIEVLDNMPALDPFLVRDMMESKGLALDDRYFQIAEAEWDRIQDHIRQRIRPMVALALPDGVMHSDERMAEMIDAIWKASDMSRLEPLIKAFLLPVEKTSEIFHSWKGVAFFEYHYMQLSEPAVQFAKWLQTGAVPSHSVNRDEQAVLDELRDTVRHKLKIHWGKATDILKNYNQSYELLFKQQGSAVNFMKFMANAPSHFWHLGDAIIRLQHALETFERMTEFVPERKLEAENLRIMLIVMDDLL